MTESIEDRSSENEGVAGADQGHSVPSATVPAEPIDNVAFSGPPAEGSGPAVDHIAPTPLEDYIARQKARRRGRLLFAGILLALAAVVAGVILLVQRLENPPLHDPTSLGGLKPISGDSALQAMQDGMRDVMGPAGGSSASLVQAYGDPSTGAAILGMIRSGGSQQDMVEALDSRLRSSLPAGMHMTGPDTLPHSYCWDLVELHEDMCAQTSDSLSVFVIGLNAGGERAVASMLDEAWRQQ